MIKFQKIILTLTSKQSLSPYCKFIKFCSQELKPRFAFEISKEVEDGLVNKKFKAKGHPGVMSLHARNVKLPPHIVEAIQQVREEEGHGLSLLSDRTKSLINYIWQRQTPLEGHELRQTLEEVATKLVNKGKMPNEFFEGPEEKSVDDLTIKTKKILSSSLKKHVYHWKPLQFDQYLSFVYVCARASPDYAALVRIFREIQMRRTEFKPATLFDFGSGVGTVTWAVDTVWPNACQEVYNVDTSSSMNKLAERLLKCSADAEIGPPRPNRNYYRQFLPSSDSLTYDLVVSSRSMFEVGSLKERARTADILWRKVNTGGFLILVEAGTQYGFSLLLEMRDYLLKICEIQREKYSLKSPIHVFAPCPHDKSCPRFEHRSNTPCYFGVSYEYPKNIKHVEKVRNDLFSYVVLQKEDRNESRSWPRIVEPILKKARHTIVRTCTSEGSLKEFVVTKSRHGTLCYRLCTKCKWGDFLPVNSQVDAGNNPVIEADEPHTTAFSSGQDDTDVPDSSS